VVLIVEPVMFFHHPKCLKKQPPGQEENEETELCRALAVPETKSSHLKIDGWS